MHSFASSSNCLQHGKESENAKRKLNFLIKTLTRLCYNPSSNGRREAFAHRLQLFMPRPVHPLQAFMPSKRLYQDELVLSFLLLRLQNPVGRYL